jgi:isocitrate/isopropylmalate dehydrogenase
MMVEHLGEAATSERMENAIKDILASGKIPTMSATGGLPTSEVGDMVAAAAGR